MVLGSAVRATRLLPETGKFLRRHRAALERLPLAYFIACLAMKEDTEKSRKIAAGFAGKLHRFKEPVGTGLFAGKLDLSTVGPVWRFFFSRNKADELAEGDFRNWEAVRDWTAEIHPLLAGPSPAQ